MSQQQLFPHTPGEPSSSQPAARGAAVPCAGRPRHPGGVSPWLRRTELLIHVLVQLYLGLLLITLPWLHFWTENSLFSYFPGTAFLAHNGFVRGAVSGLGILNVFLALGELFRGGRQD